MEWLNKLELSTLLTAMMLAWALFFCIAHGPIVFAYLAIHVCTSGLFCFLMDRIKTKTE